MWAMLKWDEERDISGLTQSERKELRKYRDGYMPSRTKDSDDLSKLVEEATKPAPQKKWYSVSIDGLTKAAENVEKVGEPVINLSRKVLSLLTLGIIN